MRLGDKRHIPSKVIDTWVYKVKDVELERMEYIPEEEREDPLVKTRVQRERVVNKIVTIEVRLEKKTKQTEEAPHPLDTVSFTVVCKELDIEMRGTDIEALRAAMWSKLDTQFEIKWERYFLVDVDQSRPFTGLGTGLTVSYDTVYKGTTWDGKLLLRRWSYRDERIELWPGEFRVKGNRVIACIPGTDANEESLKEFVRRVDLLREKLQDFLRPDQILQTLANLRGFNLLPAPERES
jgi:hypothetical protein